MSIFNADFISGLNEAPASGWITESGEYPMSLIAIGTGDRQSTGTTFVQLTFRADDGKSVIHKITVSSTDPAKNKALGSIAARWIRDLGWTPQQFIQFVSSKQAPSLKAVVTVSMKPGVSDPTRLFAEVTAIRMTDPGNLPEASKGEALDPENYY